MSDIRQGCSERVSSLAGQGGSSGIQEAARELGLEDGQDLEKDSCRSNRAKSAGEK